MSLKFLNGKTVLITGGTGSFGKRYVKHLLANSRAQKIIILSRDELKQLHMRNELSDARLRFFLGDVRDLQRLQRAFKGVDVVIHAAALKQVPTLEYNPFEAIKTNIIGTQNVIEAAIDQGVRKVLLISTDKAAQPVNLYGSTKLCAEKLFVNGNSYSSEITTLSCVRYGNVLGSRGSVVDILLQNRGKKKVTITDERMTRFWITYGQAFTLVDFALEHMIGGEIFIPKIPSMRIVDLFDALAPNVERQIIGIRPGEKLHEVLVTNEEARHAIELDKYYVILPESDGIFDPDRFKPWLSMSKKLGPDFSFMSHTNDQWLKREQLVEVIELMRKEDS